MLYSKRMSRIKDAEGYGTDGGIMITSTSNPRIKNLALLGKKAKARKEQGVFLAEGWKMIKEAPKDWIRELYVSESFLAGEENEKRLRDAEYETLSDHVMKAAADTQTPQGILAVISMPQWNFEEAAKKENGTYLFLEDIQDPGNLGTMLRSGEAAGITAVIAGGGTVDLYNPKTIRSTMGSIYRMPFFQADDFKNAVCRMKERGMKLYAAHLEGSRLYDEPDYREKCGFLIGNEGKGLTEGTSELADAYIRIPMEGKAESLNAAIAASVLMYEANRQKRR